MTGFSKLDKQKLQALIKYQPQRGGRWLTGVAEQMVGDIKQSMIDSPADGANYRRGGVTHTASSPGNPPRPDTGTLINTVRQRNAGPFHRVIEIGTEYALYLELGTERIAARPFVVPVFDDWRKKILDDAKRSLIDV